MVSSTSTTAPGTQTLNTAVAPPGAGGGAGPMNPPLTRPNVIQQALHMLLETLKPPCSPEIEAQALSILKSHPQLMAAFIRQVKWLANQMFSFDRL